MKRLEISRSAGVLMVVLFAYVGCATRDVRAPSAPREWFREGAGRTVVMLGGGVYGAAMFAPHARELSSHFDVIRVQTLNVQTARSGVPMPLEYSVSAEADALARTLSWLGVTQPVHIVGSSFGAVVALHFAVEYPERVSTVTLFEPPAFWILGEEDYERDPILREMRELTSALTPSSVPSDEQFVRFRCLLGACPAAVPGHEDAARAEWDLSRSSMRGLAAIPAHRENRARLARLSSPVLLIGGSETVAFHRRINQLLAREIRQSETAELPGTHSAPRTASVQFTERLRLFLARHDATMNPSP